MLQAIDHDALLLLITTLSVVVTGCCYLAKTVKCAQRSVNNKVIVQRQQMSIARGLLNKLKVGDPTQTSIHSASYFHQMAPEVLEELLFCCFEERGFTIKHSNRHSRDGRIDGTVAINSQEYLVTLKCNGQPVDANDLKAFTVRIKQQNATGGYFCYTASIDGELNLTTATNVKLISGHQLWTWIKEGSLSTLPAVIA